ncbi:MAG: manganese efflux pump [Bacteroidales bacterium]|nr:manganese efflux pump [Bacteroidales bacterium]MBR5671108.1 manganese efflux pump [Bacteroidales bacterium]
MTFIEILLLAIGLSFDTLAFSIVGGLCIKNLKPGQNIRIISTFGLIQAAFLLAGWLLGGSFVRYIEAYDHWVAFILLAFIGGKMIIDSRAPSDDKQVDLLDTPKLLLACVATSIDALAVGISMAALQVDIRRMVLALITVFAVTAGASELGLKGGEWAARIFGKKSYLIGGLVLIAIGVKILIEHLTA